ncbi:MAG TPA: hypothetical protein VGB01_07875 [candidate division Zixibacteria bacterium]|jgi:hypothetical protein
MNFNKKITTLISIFFTVFIFSSILAQTQTSPQKVTEMSRPRLEGLIEFHDVVYSVWHSAYPDKDYQAIRDAVPAFKEKMEVINKAELPGFFREKKEDFEKKREALSMAVLDLEEKAKGNDNIALLNATENLHTAYEQIVRVFAPRVKELENFHLVLYPLWHEALPKKDFKAIIACAPTLQEKMDSLMKVELTERFKEIAPQFIEKRKSLKTSVDELVKACNKKDNKKIEEKLDKMHAAYMELDGVFENN